MLQRELNEAPPCAHMPAIPRIRSGSLEAQAFDPSDPRGKSHGRRWPGPNPRSERICRAVCAQQRIEIRGRRLSLVLLGSARGSAAKCAIVRVHEVLSALMGRSTLGRAVLDCQVVSASARHIIRTHEATRVALLGRRSVLRSAREDRRSSWTDEAGGVGAGAASIERISGERAAWVTRAFWLAAWCRSPLQLFLTSAAAGVEACVREPCEDSPGNRGARACYSSAFRTHLRRPVTPHASRRASLGMSRRYQARGQSKSHNRASVSPCGPAI